MKTQFLRALLPGLVAGGLVSGCVMGTDEPSVEEAMRALTDPPPPPVIPIKPAPGEHAVEARPIAPDAARERRVEAMAHFSAGVSHNIRKETEKAREHFYRAGLSDSRNVKLVLRVARILIDDADSHRASLLLVEAAHKDCPAEIDAWLGIAYAREGKLDLAILASETAIRKEPKAIQGYKNLCTIYSKMKRPKDWLAAIQRADGVKGAGAGFLAELAGLYQEYSTLRPSEGRAFKPRVRELLAEARKKNPTEPATQIKLMAVLEQAGEFASAAAFAEKLLEVSPRNPKLREQAAALFIKAGRARDAEKHLEELLKIDPANSKTNWALGLMAKERRDEKKAAEHFTRVLMMNRNFEPAYFELASLQVFQGKPRDALATLERARTRFKPSFPLEYWTGSAYRRMKNYPKALAHLTVAEALARSEKRDEYLSPGLYHDLASIQQLSAQYAAAEKNYRKAIALNPDFAGALNNLGYMWVEQGENLKEAREMIAKAVKLDGNNPAYLDSMAWVTFLLGDARKALEWQLKALRAMQRDKREDAELYGHLGDIYHALKNDAKAREAWKKSLALEANPKIEERLKKLPQEKP